jgi:hypothetical protein
MFLVEWAPYDCEWLVLSRAGPFETKDEAETAAKEDRGGKATVYETPDTAKPEAVRLLRAFTHG